METERIHNNTVLEKQVRRHLDRIYTTKDNTELCRRVMALFDCRTADADPPEHWSEKDMILITYGNSISHPEEHPLNTLKGFLDRFLGDLISIVHVLPFFPYSSDDGFAVMDYYEVNPALGSWSDLKAIAEEYRLMADLVINHTSSRCVWFENFKKSQDPGKDYYVCVSPDTDLSEVVRPRTSPLLRAVRTPKGERHVWCTFSHDQVDLDFKNPEVLVEFLKIIRFYLDQGIEVFRLDAVAFLWKEQCTTCLHLPQTHEIIKLFRTLMASCRPNALIITETNVPSKENLSYLGAGDEAHVIYNFPLPPLMLNTMVTGDSTHLVNWLISVPHLLPGTSCLNFIASHDGIGLRPAEGVLSAEEIDELISCMKAFGGRVSTRALNNQRSNPYEINISLWDAFRGTLKDHEDGHQPARFVCAHAIMLSLQGIPAFYIHSLLGTRNDLKRMENLTSNRAINRHVWDKDELFERLCTSKSHHYQVFSSLKQLMAIRKRQAAFHPQAGQMIIDADSRCVVIHRLAHSLEFRAKEEVLCVYNITDEPVVADLSRFSKLVQHFQQGHDLLSGQVPGGEGLKISLAPYGFVWLSNQARPSGDGMGENK